MRPAKIMMSKKKQLQLSFEKMKRRMQIGHYTVFEHQGYEKLYPHYRENNMHGNNFRILGSVPHDVGSTQTTLTVLEDYEPNVILLGERNRGDYEEMVLQKEKYSTKPQMYSYKENLYAGKLYTKYFSKNFEEDLSYFKEPADNLIYYADIKNKRVIYDDYATAAYYAYQRDDTHLLFAKPDTTLMLEDLALRFTLEELEKMFFQCLDVSRQRLIETNAYPYPDNQQILLGFRQITREQHKDTLYGKLLVYQASLLKQCSRNYKKSFLMTNHMFPRIVEELTSEPALPEYTQIFRTFLDDTNKPSLTIDDSWKKDQDKQKMEETLELSKKKFNFEREKSLYENIKHLNPREVLEKFVILNQMIDNEMRLYLYSNENPLEITIFAELFKNYTQNEILGMFLELNQKYSLELHKLQNSEIKRVSSYTTIAGRKSLTKYNDAIQEIDKRKQIHGYEWKAGLIGGLEESMATSHVLFEQIEKNIQRRMAEGQAQTETLMELERIKSGNFTRDSIETLNALIVEANTQLGLIRLPSHLKKYMGFVKEINMKLAEKTYNQTLDEIAEEVAFAQSPYIKVKPAELLPELKGKLEDKKEMRKKMLELKFAEFKEDKDAASRSDKFMKEIEFNNSTDGQETFLNSVILGDPEDLPFDINTMSLEELRKMGAEVITDFDVKIHPSGRISTIRAPDQKEKMEKLRQTLKELGENDILVEGEEEEGNEEVNNQK